MKVLQYYFWHYLALYLIYYLKYYLGHYLKYYIVPYLKYYLKSYLVNDVYIICTLCCPFILYIYCFQFMLLCVLEMIYTSTSLLLMPFLHEPYVEITCSVTLMGFLPPLIFNMVLIVACAFFGYLTRKLPENFNDSRYIFVSISTTLFMWSVFLPTYFTAFHAHHQAALLSVCLLFNAYITMVGQFGPKIYAVLFVKEETITFNTLTQGTTATVNPSSNVPD